MTTALVAPGFAAPLDDAALAESALAQQVHLAAVDVGVARLAGDAPALARAEQRLNALSAAYLSRGKTDDELARVKAAGSLASTLDAVTGVVRASAVLIVLGILVFLWAPWRRP